MANERKLVVKILSDASGMKEGFGDADKAVGGLGKKLLGAAAAFGVVKVGADLLGDAVKGAIQDEASASALEQQIKSLGGVTSALDGTTLGYKDATKSVEKYINKLSLAQGVADDELRPAMAQILRATNDEGNAQEDLQLALNISAAKHISLAEAADLVAKAENGNTKGLKSLGISLKDSEGKALGLDEVFTKLHTTFDGAGEAAANTGEGKLRKMTVGFDEMKESIGKALLPVMTKLVDFVTGTLMPAAQSFGGWLADHKPVLIAFAAVVGVVLVSAFAAWAASAIAAAAATVAAMLPVLAPIAAVAAAVYLIIDNWDTIVDFFQKLPGRILGFLKDLPDLLLDLGKKLLQGLLDGVEWLATTGLKAYFLDIPLKILGWLGDLASLLLPVGKAILQGFLDGVIWLATTGLKAYFIDIPLKLLEWIGKAELWLFDKGKDILVGLLRGIWNGAETVIGFFTSLPGKIVGWLGDGASILWDWGKALISGIWEGIKAGWNWFSDKWNSGVGTWSWTIPDWVPILGGKGFSMPDLPHLAAGGIVTRPTLAMIGEAGPEAVIPLNRGGGMGMAGAMSVTINMPVGSDGDDVVRAIRQFENRNGPGWRR